MDRAPWKLGLQESRISKPPSGILAKIEAQMKGKPEPSKFPVRPYIEEPQKRGVLPLITPQNKSRIASDEFLRSQGKFEIETSFGIYKSTPRGEAFIPGVTATQFKDLVKILSDMETKGVVVLKTYSDKVEIMENEFARKITEADTGNVVWEKKYRDKERRIDDKTWGYRVSRSEEKFEDPSIDKSKFSPDLIRYRYRKSFEVSDTKSDIYGFQFDLTKVKEIHIKKERRNFKNVAPKEKSVKWWDEDTADVEEETMVGFEEYSMIKYEVEIERNKAIASRYEKESKKSASIDAFEKTIAIVLYGMQCVSERSQLITLQEKREAIEKHNTLFERDIREISAKKGNPIPLSSFRLWKDYWNKPENIHIDDLLGKFLNEYSVTLKLDGVRRFLLVTPSGTFSAGPPDDIWKVGTHVPSYTGTLLDTEMYLDEEENPSFYVFDILFYKGRDVRGERLKERLKKVEDIVDVLNSANTLFSASIKMKEFFTEGTFYDRVGKAFESAETTNFRLDGLIFQPNNWYKNNHTRKWKPASQMTIDFRVQKIGDSDDFRMIVGGKRGEEMDFKGSSQYPFDGVLTQPRGEYEGMNINGIIVEMQWDEDAQKFEIHRIRDDRDKPNALKTAQDVWSDIKKPISEETIRGDTLQAMRRYHNIIKAEFLSSYFKKGDSIMDWGSGRGGDLKKWGDLGLSKVYVVEPNTENLKELERRLDEMKDRGYDSSRIHVVKDDSGKPVGGQDTDYLLNSLNGNLINGITSFFSLTYFGRDSEIFNGMIDSIDTLLDVGDKFVGAVMDGDRVKGNLEADKEKEGLSENEAAEIKNASFTIAQVSGYSDTIQEGKNEIEITIEDPMSMVKEQQEWLFYFDLLKRELESRNINLIDSGFLEKGQMYDVLPVDSKRFSAMNRYFVFERTDKKNFKEILGETEEILKLVKKKNKKTITPMNPKKRLVAKKVGLAKLGVDEIAGFDNIYDIDLYQVGVVKDKATFIHAVIRAFATKYYDMEEKERTNYVKKIKAMMGRKATKELYFKLNNTELSKKYTKVELEEMSDPNEKQAKLIGFLEYRLDVIDPSAFINHEKGLELMSALLGINILILGPDSKLINDLYGRELAIAKDIMSEYSKTVILVTEDNVHYSLVVTKKNDNIISVFSTNGELVQNILNEALPLMDDGEFDD